MVRSLCWWATILTACSDGSDADSGANSLTGELAFAVQSSGYTTAETTDPWAVSIYLTDGDVRPLCGVSPCPPQTFKRNVIVIVGGSASTPLSSRTFVIDGNPLVRVQVWNFEPGGISTMSNAGAIVIENIDATIKGSFDATFPLDGGATTRLTGRFDAAMCCLPR